MMYCDVEDVIKFSNIEPEEFGLESTGELEEKIEQYIIQSTNLMDAYMRKSYSEPIPPALQNICLRIVVNMITLAQSRKNSPFIQVNDWTVKTVPTGIFTDDLKDDIKPFCKRSKNSGNFDLFVISGNRRLKW